jgi:predicted nucleotidyltransferase
MPVRSLSSSVFTWPDRIQVDEAARAWAAEAARQHPELLKAGYFGSYARGDWGVGSDLDLVAIVEETCERFERRSLSWDLSKLPVQAELLIYTEDEWLRLRAEGSRFARTLAREVVWVYHT